MRVLLLIWLSGNLLGAFAQGTTRTGFAIVTVVSGNVGGLIGTETLTNLTETGIDQTVISPSPLVTSASFLVPVGPEAENTTAIAVANPSVGSGGVNLILTDALGGVVLNTVVQLGPRSQFSKFLNDFFPTPPGPFTTPLLLTISAEIPVAVLAFNFRGTDFSSIPLASLAPPTPVPVQQLSPIPTTSTFAGFGIGLVTPPPPVTVVPAPPQPPAPQIGGASSMVFAQVASGGGWSSEISIGNTSAGLQTVRIDFFGPDGITTGSLTDIVIQPRGVFSISSDFSGVAR
jgi:hypothetical protein